MNVLDTLGEGPRLYIPLVVAGSPRRLRCCWRIKTPRTCCQLVQGGIITEPTLGKLTKHPPENYPNRIRQQYRLQGNDAISTVLVTRIEQVNTGYLSVVTRH